MEEVVISGIGAICSLGTSYKEIFENFTNGVNGFEKVSSLEFPENEFAYASEVDKNTLKHIANRYGINEDQIYTPNLYAEFPIKGNSPLITREEIFAKWCADKAIEDSGLNLNNTINNGALFLGGNLKASDVLYLAAEAQQRVANNSSLEYTQLANSIVSGQEILAPSPYPFTYPQTLAQSLQLIGGYEVYMTGCSSSNNAIGSAFRKIQSGELDFAICGGIDSPLDPVYISFFNNLGVLNKNPETNEVCSPYSANRAGFGLGEGGALFVLESKSHAQKRGANIYATISGYYSNMATAHLTDCDPEGEVFAQCIKGCMEDSKVRPEDIGYINSHGNATVIDVAETKAFKHTFKEKAYDIPISSTKPMVGHSIVGSGSLEAIACIGSLQNGILHPTINYNTKDTLCDLNYIPNTAIERKITTAMSTSFAFFGYNACLIFKN